MLRIAIKTIIVGLFFTQGNGLIGMTLAEALERAIESNRAVAVAESRVRENDGRIEAAKSAFLPTIDLSGTYTYVSRLSEIEINLPLAVPLPEISTGTHNMVDTKLSGKYRLFDWGKRRK